MYAPFAVIVYVHGESYEWNSGNAYDGRILTGYGHVIFITVNFRLGILGFLKTRGDLSDNQHCCFAISDIEAALRWVNSNIAAFGGDPTRVTLVGHDTGAALVNALMLLTSARGSMLSPWAVASSPHSVHLQVTEQVGCATPNSASDHVLHCLQELPLKSLMEVKLEDRRFLTQFGPWFSLNPSLEIERAGDTFVDRQMLLGLTSIESFRELAAQQIETGLHPDEKDEILRLFRVKKQTLEK
ncbi:neurexin protein binding [Homalodisca vitripennis]|nr:neurexin protein binding [Homalodisca vitripennis]